MSAAAPCTTRDISGRLRTAMDASMCSAMASHTVSVRESSTPRERNQFTAASAPSTSKRSLPMNSSVWPRSWQMASGGEQCHFGGCVEAKAEQDANGICLDWSFDTLSDRFQESDGGPRLSGASRFL